MSKLPPGENVIGRVGKRSVRIAVTPTVSTSPAYTAADAVGGLLTFANAAANTGLGGVIQTVTIIDLGNQKPALQLYLSSLTFTPTADNAAFTISDGDAANSIGWIPIVAGDWQSNGAANAIACVRNVGLRFHPTTTSIFGQLQTTSTPTFVGTSDIIVILEIELD